MKGFRLSVGPAGWLSIFGTMKRSWARLWAGVSPDLGLAEPFMVEVVVECGPKPCGHCCRACIVGIDHAGQGGPAQRVIGVVAGGAPCLCCVAFAGCALKEVPAQFVFGEAHGKPQPDDADGGVVPFFRHDPTPEAAQRPVSQFEAEIAPCLFGGERAAHEFGPVRGVKGRMLGGVRQARRAQDQPFRRQRGDGDCGAHAVPRGCR
mmetsp:Transcript_23420/g.41068  ORF Transcript_23420/g.41068 Transcript_23420/m.41068 type:complete len:206 (+) Transcript_23420:2459-3076(+)